MIPFYRTDYQKPLRLSGVFYFTVVVAGVVAREVFSIEIQIVLNLNDTRNSLYRSNFADDLQIRI